VQDSWASCWRAACWAWLIWRGRPAERLKIDEVVLFDMAVPDRRPAGLDHRAIFATGEVSDKAAIDRLVDRQDIGIFTLPPSSAAAGEADFDLAMRVNLTGHLHLLEAARATGSGPRVVFASSIAVFGGSAMPKTVGDTIKQVPQTTYGMTKAVGELLINDYSRKGISTVGGAAFPPSSYAPASQCGGLQLCQRRLSRALERRRMHPAGRSRYDHAGRGISHRGSRAFLRLYETEILGTGR